MSKKTFSITCPNCGTVQDVELYEVVDICTEPDKKEEIMCNKFNRTSCIDCCEDFRIDLPILYKDERQGIFIHWVPKTPDISIENIIEEFDEIVCKIESKRDLLNIRLVFTRVELVELIYMIESQINHRVIEYIKYSIFERNLEKLNPVTHKLLLNVEDSTEDELCFVVQNIKTQELGEILRYGRSAYHSLVELFNEDPEEFFLMFPGPYICANYFINGES